MIIDGKKIAAKILSESKDILIQRGLKLRLDMILVGDDPSLKKFVEIKIKAADEIGIAHILHEFPENISSDNLVIEVRKIVAAGSCSGAFLELSLPKHID